MDWTNLKICRFKMPWGKYKGMELDKLPYRYLKYLLINNNAGEYTDLFKKYVGWKD
jgi:uncharacterized protein (DUF3820 family)